MVAAPEVAIPMQIASHPKILMIPFITFSILLILIGIIVYSTAKTSTPGLLIMFLGFLVGGGAFYTLSRPS